MNPLSIQCDHIYMAPKAMGSLKEDKKKKCSLYIWCVNL